MDRLEHSGRLGADGAHLARRILAADLWLRGYEPYEELVRKAAANVGLPATAPQALEDHWDELPVWSGAKELLDALKPHCKLAVVTNCSRHLGERAAARLGIAWDVVVTSEEAGFYKPDPRPYQLALEQLGVKAEDAAFVAVRATTCLAQPASDCALIGTTVLGWLAPKAHRSQRLNRPRWRARWHGCGPSTLPLPNYPSSIHDLP